MQQYNAAVSFYSSSLKMMIVCTSVYYLSPKIVVSLEHTFIKLRASLKTILIRKFIFIYY
jgi:hypothetical protein